MKKIFALLLFVAFSFNAFAEEKGEENKKLDNDFKFSVLSYLHYHALFEDSELKENKFSISRAYFTAKKKYNDILSFRMTFDVYDDDDGVELRLKYAYANFKLPDFSVFTKPNIEFGIAHTPWLDFEEHINYYRMQGYMFAEKNKTFNSADLGATFTTLLGGEIDKDYQNRVSKKYPGRYGSLQFGVYNGGGYHDLENLNENNIFQMRLTARPLPDIVPGFQLSGLIVRGNGEEKIVKDTIKVNPQYNVNILMASYEHERFTLTAQYIDGKGNYKTSKYDIDGVAQPYNGYSLFGEYKFGEHWKLMARYDSFDNDMNNMDADAHDYAGIWIIGGIGYDFGDRNILLIDVENWKPRNENHSLPSIIGKLTMQIHLD
jgi:hypothetical protein